MSHMNEAFRKLSSWIGIPAVCVASTLSIPQAQAQTLQNPYWFPLANSDCPLRGPEKATGLVIWSHGRVLVGEDSTAPTPPYIQTLCANGWDTVRFNRLGVGDNLTDSPPVLIKKIHKYKEQGYQQIILAGQSYGSFESLIAAGPQIDTQSDINAVIAVAPAAFGTNKDGSSQLNATRLYEALEKVSGTKIMLFFFHGDIFDPGGRGPKSNEILARRSTASVVVDRPAGFETHWAANEQSFARYYGPCIVSFVSNRSFDDNNRSFDAYKDCPPSGLSAYENTKPPTPPSGHPVATASNRASSGTASAMTGPR